MRSKDAVETITMCDPIKMFPNGIVTAALVNNCVDVVYLKLDRPEG